MTSSEPYLFNVSLMRTTSSILTLKFSHSLPPMGLFMHLGSYPFAPLESLFELVVRGTIIEIRFESNAMLIQSDRMAEMFDMGVESCEWQTLGNHPNRTDSVPFQYVSLCFEIIAKGVYQTPIISISTSMEKAFLNAALCRQPVSSSREYIL